MLDVRHTAFAGKIFEKSLLINDGVTIALLVIVTTQTLVKSSDFLVSSHSLCSFRDFKVICFRRLPNRLIKKSPKAYNTGGLLENAVLAQGDMVWLFLLQRFKEQVQGRLVSLYAATCIYCPYLI